MNIKNLSSRQIHEAQSFFISIFGLIIFRARQMKLLTLYFDTLNKMQKKMKY